MVDQSLSASSPSEFVVTCFSNSEFTYFNFWDVTTHNKEHA